MISIIIPTYNSEKYMKACLESLIKQDFSRRDYEVLVIDGGSTDKTLKIVESLKSKLDIRIIDNKNVDAESGKRLGLQQASGEIICLLDSDNVVHGKHWLKDAQQIFERYPEVWGVESPWFVDPKDALINQYFSMLRIADPVARLFSPVKPIIRDYGKYEILEFHTKDTPVTGANGFFWRKKLMVHRINETNKFEETNYVSFLISKGHNKMGRLKNTGIYHYYCDSIIKYFKKRAKIAKKFLHRKSINQNTWVDNVGFGKLLLSSLYNISLIGPAIESLYQIIRTKNIAWIYHPVISNITVLIYAYYFVYSKVIHE